MLSNIFLYLLAGLLLRVLLTVIGISAENVDRFRSRINYVVFYYIIPFVCLKTAYSMPFGMSHIKISVVANLTILSAVGLSLLIYKRIGKIKGIKSEIIGSLVMCSAFGNVLYIGLPILTELYGDEGMSYAFTYDFLASTPLTWTVAVLLCMKYGRAKAIKIKDSFLTILKIPPIWGLLLGFLMREVHIDIPSIILESIGVVSGYVTSLMLVIVGLSIKAVTPERFFIALPAIGIKLLVSPILAFIYGNLFGLSDIPLNVCLIEASMPSMLLSMIFATAFGVDMRTAVEMIFLTTIFSLVLISSVFLFF